MLKTIFCVLRGTSVPGNFFLLGGTNSILRTFLGGTSKKNHPVEDVHLLLVGDVCGFKVLAPPEKLSKEANIGGGGN